MQLSQYIKSNLQIDQNGEILFFGGSFNPWHNGHSSCLELAPEQSKIIVIPDHNPFKEVTLMDDKLSSTEEIKKNIKKINNSNIYLFDHYLKENKKNPSHKWIQELKSEIPQLKISLLMGFDTFISLDKWIESEKVIKNLHGVYVASRLDNEAIKKNQIEILNKINSNLRVNFLGNHKFEHLSSTDIRNA